MIRVIRVIMVIGVIRVTRVKVDEVGRTAFDLVSVASLSLFSLPPYTRTHIYLHEATLTRLTRPCNI